MNRNPNPGKKLTGHSFDSPDFSIGLEDLLAATASGTDETISATESGTDETISAAESKTD